MTTKKTTTKKSTTAKKPLAVANSMQAASAAWDVPLSVLKAASAAGCPAFHASGRIRYDDFMAWLADNHDIAEDAQARDTSSMEREELEKEKLRAQIAILRTRDEREKGLLIEKTECRQYWARCMAIVQDEARNLINDSDRYRIFCERLRDRLRDDL